MIIPIMDGKHSKVTVRKAMGLLNEIRLQFLYNQEEMQDIFEENVQRAKSHTIAN